MGFSSSFFVLHIMTACCKIITGIIIVVLLQAVAVWQCGFYSSTSSDTAGHVGGLSTTYIIHHNNKEKPSFLSRMNKMIGTQSKGPKVFIKSKKLCGCENVLKALPGGGPTTSLATCEERCRLKTNCVGFDFLTTERWCHTCKV